MQTIYDPLNQAVFIFATPEEILGLSVTMRDRRKNAKLGESLTVLDQPIAKSNMVLKISVDPDPVMNSESAQKLEDAFWRLNEDCSPENMEGFRQAWEVFQRKSL